MLNQRLFCKFIQWMRGGRFSPPHFISLSLSSYFLPREKIFTSLMYFIVNVARFNTRGLFFVSRTWQIHSLDPRADDDTCPFLVFHPWPLAERVHPVVDLHRTAKNNLVVCHKTRRQHFYFIRVFVITAIGSTRMTNQRNSNFSLNEGDKSYRSSTPQAFRNAKISLVL